MRLQGGLVCVFAILITPLVRIAARESVSACALCGEHNPGIDAMHHVSIAE
jgi:hypothetical protein